MQPFMVNDKTTRIIADNLKRTRTQKGLTQAELAQKSGISTGYYARLERAEVTPSIDVIERIVKALSVKSSKILPF